MPGNYKIFVKWILMEFMMVIHPSRQEFVVHRFDVHDVTVISTNANRVTSTR